MALYAVNSRVKPKDMRTTFLRMDLFSRSISALLSSIVTKSVDESIFVLTRLKKVEAMTENAERAEFKSYVDCVRFGVNLL